MTDLKAIWRVANRRRLRNALRYLASGKVGLLRQKVQSVVERSEAQAASLPLQQVLALARSDPAKLAPLPESIDLIVPVYDNLAALPRLFDSLRDNTSTAYRLIVIDDASSDSDVLPYLKTRLTEHREALLLEQPENRGFVGSVNLASQSVKNHFAIINSDVELPPDWLQRLMVPILRDPAVASTTPFTNAGTICSFPKANEDNDLFLGLEVAILDRAFQRIDPIVAEIELPTGVGFCMGINLAAWQQIGGFDEAAFGRGYGEENDWCLRAKAEGLRNLLVPNLFVRHEHGGSFGAESGAALKDRNLLRVHQRHPSYQSALDAFLRRDPMAPHRALAAVTLASGYGSDRKGATLIFDHDLGGGANHYRQEEVKRHLAAGQAVLLLTNAANDLLGKTSYSLKAHTGDLSFHFTVEALSELQALVRQVKIDSILCSNILSYPDPLDTLEILRALKTATDATLILAIHDFFPLCPSQTLLNSEGRFCDLPEESVCARCLPANRYSEAPKNTAIGPWRQAWSALMEQADEIRCFSGSSRALVERIYPSAARKICVTPHQLPTPPLRRPKLSFDGPLHVGIVGAIGYAKGADLVIELARLLQQAQPAARVTVIGTLESAKPPGNVSVTGPYDPSDLADLIEQRGINIAFFPSVWPETFSYVVAELMALQVPLCCFDLGAPAERLKAYPLGRTIPETTAASALKMLTSLFEEVQAKT